MASSRRTAVLICSQEPNDSDSSMRHIPACNSRAILNLRSPGSGNVGRPEQTYGIVCMKPLLARPVKTCSG